MILKLLKILSHYRIVQVWSVWASKGNTERFSRVHPYPPACPWMNLKHSWVSSVYFFLTVMLSIQWRSSKNSLSVLPGTCLLFSCPLSSGERFGITVIEKQTHYGKQFITHIFLQRNRGLLFEKKEGDWKHNPPSWIELQSKLKIVLQFNHLSLKKNFLL